MTTPTRQRPNFLTIYLVIDNNLIGNLHVWQVYNEGEENVELGIQ